MTIRQTLLVFSTVLAVGSCSAEQDLTPEAPADASTEVAVAGQDDAPVTESDEIPASEDSGPALRYEAREGKALFEHYCSTCHGEEGQGDGFNAYNLDPKPRDLSELAFQESRSDEELSELIRLGGASAGLSTAMPPWGRTIDDRGIDYLVSYVRELRAAADGSDSGGD